MSRFQRALAHTDMDAFAQSQGIRDAAEYAALLELHSRLDSGGRITPADIEAAHLRGTPLEQVNKISDYVNAGRTARDRADRYAACVSHAIESVTGQPVDHGSVRDQARREAEQFSVMKYADPLTRALNGRDEHRDKANGMDSRTRVEAAHRAALQNPETVRKSDLEREWSRHTGGEPVLYPADRRERLAQWSDHIAERHRGRMVRDADPQRRADRSDDRSADIALAYDQHAVQELAQDELALGDNPLLEATDIALTESIASASE